MAIELIELVGCNDKNISAVNGALMARFSGWTIHRTKDAVFILCVTGKIAVSALPELLREFGVTARVTTIMSPPKLAG